MLRWIDGEWLWQRSFGVCSADNVESAAGSGGPTFATDQRASDSVHFPLIKLAWGALDTFNILDAASGKALPIQGEAAENAAVTGNPVLTGGRYDATPRTLGDGDVGAIALDADGAVQIADGGNAITVDWAGTAPPIGAGVEATALRVTVATDSTGVLSIDDNGGSLTVDNAALSVTGGGTEASALRVTIASDSTGTLSIDDGGGAITVDGTVNLGTAAVTNAGTFAVQEDGAALTALQLIDDPVFADDAAFTLASSKVSMAGAIRDDALSTLTAIEGDAVPLRVSSTGALHVTGAGGGTQYNVDDAAGATDTGTLALAIRDDSLTTLTPADGDYVGLRVSSTGALHVTGGGGGTEYNEDDATPATITGTATMMERDDALGTLTPIEGDWAAMRCSAEGALWVQEFNSDAILADTANMDTNLATIAGAISGTEMQVDLVSANVTNAGTFAVQAAVDELPAAAALTDNFANPTTTSVAAMGMVWDSATWDRMPGDATNGVTVNLGSNNDVTVTGTVTVDLGANNDVTATGNVAHNEIDSGNPVKIGAKATNSIEGLTQVADADRTDIRADLNGVIITRPHTTLEEILSERVSDTGGTSTAFTTFAAGGAGIHNYVTTIVAFNSSGTDGYVDIRDGAAGSVLMTIPLPTTGGATINLPVPLKGSANTALAYDVSAALSTVYITLVGFQAQG